MILAANPKQVKSATIDLFRNMRARLVLLLPQQVDNRRVRCAVYTVAIQSQSVDPERNLFEYFLQKVGGWNDEKCALQLLEIRRLLTRAVERGVDGYKFRKEGEAFALPEDRYEGWELTLPEELRRRPELLQKLPALRLYCTTACGHLVLFDGNVKRSRAVADEDSNVKAEFNQATRLALVLKGFVLSGRLRNRSRSGLLDLDHLGIFDIDDLKK